MVNPFSNLADEELMALYQKGDTMAFEVLYARHNKKVYTYLKKRLHNTDEINDIFQNVFIKFHKSKNRYDSQFLLLKWLYTICRSELLDHLKKASPVQLSFDEQMACFSEDGDKNKEQGEYVDIDGDHRLSLKEKEALKLRYYSDRDFIDISKQLDTSTINVRKLISRGLAKLRLKYGVGHE